MYNTVCNLHMQLMQILYFSFPPGALTPLNSFYGAGNSFSWLENVDCDGDESTLLECGHEGIGVTTTSCTHFGVACLLSKNYIHVY